MKQISKLLLFASLSMMLLSMSSCGKDDFDGSYLDVKTIVGYVGKSKSKVESALKKHGYKLDATGAESDYLWYTYVNPDEIYGTHDNPEVGIVVRKSDNVVFEANCCLINDGEKLLPLYKDAMNDYKNNNASFYGKMTKGTEDSVTVGTYTSYSQFLSALNATSSIQYGFEATWKSSDFYLYTDFYDEAEVYDNCRFYDVECVDMKKATSAFIESYGSDYDK